MDSLLQVGLWLSRNHEKLAEDTSNGNHHAQTLLGTLGILDKMIGEDRSTDICQLAAAACDIAIGLYEEQPTKEIMKERRTNAYDTFEHVRIVVAYWLSNEDRILDDSIDNNNEKALLVTIAVTGMELSVDAGADLEDIESIAEDTLRSIIRYEDDKDA